MKLMELYSTLIGTWVLMPVEWQDLILETLGRRGMGVLALIGLVIWFIARAYNQGLLPHPKADDDRPVTGHGVL